MAIWTQKEQDLLFLYIPFTITVKKKQTKNANRLHTSRQSEDSLLKRKKEKQAKLEKWCAYVCDTLILARHLLKFQAAQVPAAVQVLNVGDKEIQNLKNWATSKMLPGQHWIAREQDHLLFLIFQWIWSPLYSLRSSYEKQETDNVKV